MFKLLMKIAIMILMISFLQDQSNALNWNVGDFNMPNSGWPGGSEVLNTYNVVTVKMFDGGYVSQFNMYGNSELTMYDGHISELNLYPNATAILRGGNIFELWVDPASTGLVELYAHNVLFMPSSGPTDAGSVMGNWISNNQFFQINFNGDRTQGEITRSHIQIIPEPATIAMLGLGALAVLRSRRK